MATEISRQGRVVKRMPTLFENNKRWAEKMEVNEDESNALSGEERLNRLCELNVLAQAGNVSRANIIREGRFGGEGVTVHRWIYGLSNGRLKGLADSLTSRSGSCQRRRNRVIFLT